MILEEKAMLQMGKMYLLRSPVVHGRVNGSQAVETTESHPLPPAPFSFPPFRSPWHKNESRSVTPLPPSTPPFPQPPIPSSAFFFCWDRKVEVAPLMAPQLVWPSTKTSRVFSGPVQNSRLPKTLPSACVPRKAWPKAGPPSFDC